VTGHDEVGSDELARGREEAAQHGGGGRERRVRDDPERLAGQPQVRHVGADDLEARCAGEPGPEEHDPPRVELEGDDARAGLQQVVGDRASARAEVEHEVAGFDAGTRHEPAGPVVSESMPPPSRPYRGHDGPSP
jgi:hypothetical protein